MLNKTEIKDYIDGIAEKQDKPFICFDLETTDLDIQTAEIIQFCAVKINPKGGFIQELTFKCKPTITIHPMATKAHGYKEEDLKDEKPFSDFISEIVNFFDGIDIITGFNIIRFDSKLLENQLERNGIKDFFKDKIIFDSYLQYMADDPRKLANAFKHYVGREFTEGHDARNDVYATLYVTAKQLERHGMGLESLIKKIEASQQEKEGLDRYIKIEGCNSIINFGKYKGRSINEVDKGYIVWLQGQSFPKVFKSFINKYLSEIESKNVNK